MKLPTLYSRTTNGAIQIWIIEIKKNSYCTTEGLQNGKMTTNTPTICRGKSIGRSNETSDEKQAELEAIAKWNKKKESGYFENIADIDNETFTEPMLAKKFDDMFDEGMFPVYANVKLDGARCIAKKSGLFSRNGKPIISVPQLPFYTMTFYSDKRGTVSSSPDNESSSILCFRKIHGILGNTFLHFLYDLFYEHYHTVNFDKYACQKTFLICNITSYSYLYNP